MFTEEVMSDEHEGATLFPQGGLQKGPVQLDYRLHSHCRRKKGEGKDTPNRLTQPNQELQPQNQRGKWGNERTTREERGEHSASFLLAALVVWNFPPGFTP